MFSSLPSGTKKAMLVPVVLLFLVACLAGAYFFNLKATVNLAVKPEVSQKAQAITFSSASDTDFSKQVIGASVTSVTQSANATTQATGTKQIGDKAKGEVTLYSRFTQNKTFPAGTTLSGPSGLQFVFDKDVSVASASADASAAPVTAKVSVTASKLGKESNLPSGTKFSVGDFSSSDIIAKNDSAFSGGSQKDVTVVAKADTDNLAAQVIKQGEDKAKDELKKTISSDDDIIPVFLSSTLKEKDFSKNVNEEASSVTLKATVLYTALTYKKSALQDFGKQLFKDNSSDKNLAKNGIEIDMKDAKVKDDKTVSANVDTKASFVPKYDFDDLKKQIKGKSENAAIDLLKKQPQIEDVVITYSPNIPFIPKLLPQSFSHITITLEQ
jgi:hypothetical protein